MPKTVVLIHGAWLTAASWDLVRARYEAADYAIAWAAEPARAGAG